MNKNLWRNGFLASCLLGFALLSCDLRSEEEKWQAEISYFIMQQADDYENYQAQDFQRIDREFLEGHTLIYQNLMVLKDTTRTKLSYYNVLEDLDEQLIASLQKKLLSFPVDQLDEFLMEKAALDRALSAQMAAVPKALTEARRKERQALDILSKQLANYNLSIYNIDLDGGPNVYYLHKFQWHNTPKSGVFELDKATGQVVSFMEIG